MIRFPPMRQMRVFARRTAGSVTVELVFAIILLNMVLVAFYSWWSAYSAQVRVDRALYTVSDLISRQRGTALDRSFLDGMERMTELLIREDQNAAMRFVQVTRTRGLSNDPEGLRVDWSYSPCTALPAALTDAPGFALADLPLMAVGTTMLVTEVSVPFLPQSVLVRPVTFQQRVVAIPRFEQGFALTGAGTASCID